jgi:hypothetical protein
MIDNGNNAPKGLMVFDEERQRLCLDGSWVANWSEPDWLNIQREIARRWNLYEEWDEKRKRDDEEWLHPDSVEKRLNALRESAIADQKKLEEMLENRRRLRRLGTKKEEESKPDFMPKVNGKSFKCDCGCNVFKKGPRRPHHKKNEEQYICNSCGSEYIGEA